MLLYLNFPSFIHPEIIPGIPLLRWYSLMYLLAFTTSFLLLKYLLKKKKILIKTEALESFFVYMIIGLLIGGRLFSVLIYEESNMYLIKPWLIFWPFDSNWNFIGLQGMSYHGGTLGAIIGAIIYCHKMKWSFWGWADMTFLCAPLGYTFGRLGNYANAELYGRATEHPFGTLFPTATPYSTSLNWVREMAQNLGIAIEGAWVNLPRHPSQLYEAFFEGIILWCILWFGIYPKQKVKGSIVTSYIFGYGFVRFFIEYLREPDANLMYPIQLGSQNIRFSWLNFTTGQILNFIMMAIAVLLYFYLRAHPSNQPLVPVITKKQKNKKVTKKQK